MGQTNLPNSATRKTHNRQLRRSILPVRHVLLCYAMPFASSDQFGAAQSTSVALSPLEISQAPRLAGGLSKQASSQCRATSDSVGRALVIHSSHMRASLGCSTIPFVMLIHH